MPLSPSTFERNFAELEQIAKLRSKLEELEQSRDEFSQEMQRGRSEETNLSKCKTLLEELTQEKMAHVEELRQINNDINALETTIKQSESEMSRSNDTARQVLGDTMRLQGEFNITSQSLGEEAINENILNEADVTKLWEQTRHQQQQHQPPMAVVHPLLQPEMRGAMQLAQAQMEAAHNMLMGNQSTSTIDRQEDLDNIAGSSFQKQQPPPMKTCTSCQQLIHRNAPICPMCKSKSRSKNPKKPKQRRTDE